MDAATWDERFAENAHPWGLEPNRFVREHCERLHIGAALDLGCGDGRHALWLARLGWHVTGVDFSAVALEQARERTAERDAYQALRLRWRQADVSSFVPKAGAFDLVLLSYLQLAEPLRTDVLRRSAKALRIRGHVVVVAHDLRNLAEGDGGPADSAVLYQPDDVASVLRDEGLFIEVARTAERPTADGVALDCVVRARLPDPALRVD